VFLLRFNDLKRVYLLFNLFGVSIIRRFGSFRSFDFGMIYVHAILESEGTMLFEATNGREAVNFVKNNPDIDLVLMDLKMPEMDGFEATRQIKKIRPTLPVIAQTAYAFLTDQEKAAKAGCDDYISKPLKKEILLAKIQKYK